MEYLENSIFSFPAFWLMFKNIYLDIENRFSRFDLFLQSVPKFLSTKWNSFGGKKTQVSNSSEARQQGPIRDNRYSDVEKTMDISEINLVMSRLGVWCAMEGAENRHDNKLYGEDDFLTLFDEEEPSLEEIKETFEVFDSNKDGFIDCSELRRVLCALGLRQGCDLEDCKRMIRDFDVNGDGLIDFREFVIFMEKCFSNAKG
ncbi:probable calcium-binding protein CML46 [Primulina eburnea]|uniref:probable calcium-binding protein CML46 n=1 Tax=Primulina eburnea TaxID=1245227 RepID=UPI003C6BEA2F